MAILKDGPGSQCSEKTSFRRCSVRVQEGYAYVVAEPLMGPYENTDTNGGRRSVAEKFAGRLKVRRRGPMDGWGLPQRAWKYVWMVSCVWNAIGRSLQRLIGNRRVRR